MNSQPPPFEHPFKIRLERGAVLPLVWLALGSAALAEIAARSVPAAIVLDLQHGLWERGSIEAAAGIAGGCTSVIARTADFSAPAVGAALDAGVAAVMAPLVESADDARVLAGASPHPPQGRRSGGGRGGVGGFCLVGGDRGGEGGGGGRGPVRAAPQPLSAAGQALGRRRAAA